MSPIIGQMQNLLEPARQRLKRLRVNAALWESVSLIAWVLPTVLGVTLVLGLLAAPYGALTPAQLSLILGSALLSVIVCLALKCTRPLLDDPSWLDTATLLDKVSNRHNFIAIAYDAAQQGRSSLFARMAIDKGMLTLEGNRQRNFFLDHKACAMGKVGMGLLGVLILLIVIAMVPHVGVDRVGMQGTSLADLSGLASEPLAQAINPTEEPTPAEPAQTAIPSSRSSTQAQQQQAVEAGLSQSRALAGTSQSQAASTQQPFSAQSPSASAAQAQDSPPSETQTAKKRAAKTGDATVPPEEENTAPPARTQQKAGNSGAPDAESKLKASLLSGEADQDDDLDNDDDKRQDAEQKRALTGTGGQPLLADRAAAPSRELGMSGKKGNQPPEGRGGPSGQKKSRATATILSGMPVAVHVKGIKQEGKSKSQARAMPLSPSDVQAPPAVTVKNVGQEGLVQRYDPAQSWQAVLERYFQSLRQSESNSAN